MIVVFTFVVIVVILFLLLFFICMFCIPANERCVTTHAFVKALIEKETPKIYESQALGYIYVFNLFFNDVNIKLDYNDVRSEWSMDIWCPEANQFLFWYTCIDTAPIDAINLLIEKYKLDEKLEIILEQDQDKKNKEIQIANKVIVKILGK